MYVESSCIMLTFPHANSVQSWRYATLQPYQSGNGSIEGACMVHAVY